MDNVESRTAVRRSSKFEQTSSSIPDGHPRKASVVVPASRQQRWCEHRVWPIGKLKTRHQTLFPSAQMAQLQRLLISQACIQDFLPPLIRSVLSFQVLSPIVQHKDLVCAQKSSKILVVLSVPLMLAGGLAPIRQCFIYSRRTNRC